MLHHYTFEFDGPLELAVYGIIAGAWLWIPIVFAAYAIGRRKVRIWFFFALTLLEGLALWLVNTVFKALLT